MELSLSQVLFNLRKNFVGFKNETPENSGTALQCAPAQVNPESQDNRKAKLKESVTKMESSNAGTISSHQ